MHAGCVPPVQFLDSERKRHHRVHGGEKSSIKSRLPRCVQPAENEKGIPNPVDREVSGRVNGDVSGPMVRLQRRRPRSEATRLDQMVRRFGTDEIVPRRLCAERRLA